MDDTNKQIPGAGINGRRQNNPDLGHDFQRVGLQDRAPKWLQHAGGCLNMPDPSVICLNRERWADVESRRNDDNGSASKMRGRWEGEHRCFWEQPVDYAAASQTIDSIGRPIICHVRLEAWSLDVAVDGP
jgi:hypothetical protein